jgi:hypothetical protein
VLTGNASFRKQKSSKKAGAFCTNWGKRKDAEHDILVVLVLFFRQASITMPARKTRLPAFHMGAS